MKPVILDNIPFQPSSEAVRCLVETKVGQKSAEMFQAFIEEAQEIARPKALYKMAYIREKGDDFIRVGGQIFRSRILCENLENVHRVFFYVATCGQELEEWKDSKPDMLEQYYADVVGELALDVARERLIEFLEDQYQIAQTASMAPGSLPDWPIQEQRPLFALMGDTEEAIGVRLLDSLLMSPTKTVSGIRYPSESSFASCQLCTRANCPNRKAPYDAEEYAQRFL